MEQFYLLVQNIYLCMQNSFSGFLSSSVLFQCLSFRNEKFRLQLSPCLASFTDAHAHYGKSGRKYGRHKMSFSLSFLPRCTEHSPIILTLFSNMPPPLISCVNGVCLIYIFTKNKFPVIGQPRGLRHW